MFKMATQSKKPVKCLLSYVLCMHTTDLSVTDLWVPGLLSSPFASVNPQTFWQLPPQTLLYIIIVWFKETI